MRRSLVLWFAVVLSLFAGVATACSCVPSEDESPTASIERAYRGSTSVVLATVVSVQNGYARDDPTLDSGLQRVHWRVAKRWKGGHAADTTFISESGWDGAACGYPVREGQTHLLYLDGKAPYSLGLCGMSAESTYLISHFVVLDRLAAQARTQDDDAQKPAAKESAPESAPQRSAGVARRCSDGMAAGPS